MSHFTVAVFTKTGSEEEIKNVLARFREKDGDNLPKEWLTFVEVESEKRQEFENNKRHSFYCNSYSSWGQEISKENYEKLANKKIGDSVFLEVAQIGIQKFFEKNKRYKCYFNKDNKCPDDKDYIWIIVNEIIETKHPDKDVCFEGKICVEIINPPKQIPLKDYYNNDFDLFMKDWCDITDKENGKYGYWTNLLGNWDWYKIGGRWDNHIQTKNGKTNTAIIKDIIFDINENDRLKAIREWELYIENLECINEEDKNLLKNMNYKKEYYIKRYKTKEHYAYCMSRFSTFAFVLNGEWIGKGKMGWFACDDSSFETEIEYFKKFDEAIKNNSELYLTIVDCHI